MRRPSILIVEEDEALRDALVKAVRALGASAEVARGPAEALAFLAASWPPPAAVLLDLQTCGDAGTQVVRDLRAQPRHRALPVLTIGRAADGSPPALDGCDPDEVARLLLSLCRTEAAADLPGLRWMPQPA